MGRGYLQVRVMVNGHRYCVSAHRLVWLHFHGETLPPSIEINHKNGVKWDNRPSNLEAVTASENMKHAHRTGLKNQNGERNPATKLSNKDTQDIRERYALGGVTQQVLADEYGISHQSVSKIVRGDRRQTNSGAVADYTYRRKHQAQRDKCGRFTAVDAREHKEYPEVHHG